MSAVLNEIEAPQFFAPTSSSALDVLLGQYRQARDNIERVADFMAGQGMTDAAAYFIAGNKERFHRFTPSAGDLFSRDAAIPALNAAYWKQALNLTDVLDYMPDAKRRAWFEQIEQMETPDFEEATVRATLSSLLAQRMDFLAEMVDGIFRGLSGEHVTNVPEGFRRRMIIQGVMSDYGMTGRRAGLVHDLRSVIAKLMARGQPHYNVNAQMLNYCRARRGEWQAVDGGALRVRVYANGNAHLEVHPEIAHQLNRILAHLHPAAIPSRFRTAPDRTAKLKDFELMERPLPFAVLDLLSDGKFYPAGTVIPLGYGKKREYPEHTFSPSYREKDKHVAKAAGEVLEAIGGVKDGGSYVFDYNAEEVIREVIATGVIPDHKSHQYYPTPQRLAAEAVALAEIGAEHWCLEPSAGQGAIAEMMPADRTLCVEVSPLHCIVLEAKELDWHCIDFLSMAPEPRFDRIVMNPPFSQGRAAAHVQHAAKMLAPGGRLVAILPASFAGKDLLPGMACTWSRIYENEFKGASIDVVILTAEVT